MIDEEVKQKWNEQYDKHAGKLLHSGVVDVMSVWSGFVMALDRPDLIGYRGYSFLIEGMRDRIEFK